MFTDILLREPQAYKCGLCLASLSEDKDIKILICLRAANMWNHDSYSFKGYFKFCSHIIENEHVYQEKCYPIIQQNIHISAIRKGSYDDDDLNV